MPRNRKPFPILSALRREGDTFTLKSLRVWMDEYDVIPPLLAANDNNPNAMPTIVETRIDAVSADHLVLSLEEDEKCRLDPTFERTTRPYSLALHEERFERVKSASKSAPPAAEIDAEAEMARYIDAAKMRDWLGADAEILDMAVGQCTYIDVGRHIGVEGSAKTAYRAGRQEVKDVAKTFYDEAA